MREILFRGKRVDNGKWVYGGVCQSELWTEIFEVKDIQGDSYTPDSSEITEYEVIPETVGQYTGLKDKNGAKIFEGDIFVDEEDEVVSVVDFREGSFCLVDYGVNGALTPYSMNSYYIDEMKIDGNIHDNPEPLKGDKQ